MSNVYDIGDGVRLTAAFTVADVATDPTTVTLTLTDPSANSSSPSPTNSGTGAYYEDIVVDESGSWHYRFVGTGAVVAASEGHLSVRKKEGG